MKILALALNVAAVLALLGSGLMALMSPMIFDAPDSSGKPLLWVLFVCFLLMPVLLLLGLYNGWRQFAQGNYLPSIYAYKWVLYNFIAIVMAFLVAGKA